MSNINRWDAQNIPDLTGKTIIITGANSGLGLETTRALARKNAEIIMACRNQEKAASAKKQIRSEIPQARLIIMPLDLADLTSIRRFAIQFQNEYQKLDVLINNAGLMMLKTLTHTKDGFEMQFGINHLGHFALVGLLLETLLKTPTSRVIAVSSNAHNFGKLNFNNLNSEKRYSRSFAYFNSKLANLLFTYEFQRKLEAADASTIAAAAHPGWSNTNLQAYSGIMDFVFPIFGQTAEMGALPILYAASMPDVKGGKYFGPDGFQGWRGYPTRVSSNARSKKIEDASKLWAVSEDLTGIQYTF
ncbi:MAG: SDR family NAD(P)-dependent oxidoreductase [Anaerolineaceae bacterium]|nr:SDR family NAD(P)-dependent oxidoreductase [Anaerolineaceae bacterium]